MTQFRTLLEDFRLTTAEIVYYMPDHPAFLQTYLWQEYDCPPNYPKLLRFLEFWNQSLEGKLHSVRVVVAGNLQIPDFRAIEFDGRIN